MVVDDTPEHQLLVPEDMTGGFTSGLAPSYETAGAASFILPARGCWTSAIMSLGIARTHLDFSHYFPRYRLGMCECLSYIVDGSSG